VVGEIQAMTLGNLLLKGWTNSGNAERLRFRAGNLYIEYTKLFYWVVLGVGSLLGGLGFRRRGSSFTRPARGCPDAFRFPRGWGILPGGVVRVGVICSDVVVLSPGGVL